MNAIYDFVDRKLHRYYRFSVNKCTSQNIHTFVVQHWQQLLLLLILVAEVRQLFFAIQTEIYVFFVGYKAYR